MVRARSRLCHIRPQDDFATIQKKVWSNGRQKTILREPPARRLVEGALRQHLHSRRTRKVMSFIQLSEVMKSFSEGSADRHVLDGLDMNVERGEFVVLMGRSGAGKSTLLNLIGGLDSAAAGRIRIGEFDIHDMDEEQRTLFRRQHLGFVFQAYNLIPTLTVLENVMLPLELAETGSKRGSKARSSKASDRSGRREKAVRLLEDVGLGDRAGSYPDVLSGGEQQRVAVVRALIHDPLLLLADEPTGNLDYQTGRQVMDLLHDLVRKTGTTMLVVTHDRDFLRASDRVLELRGGRLHAVSSDEFNRADPA